MGLNHAQHEVLFAGLDWRRIKASETRPPAAAERIIRLTLRVFVGYFW